MPVTETTLQAVAWIIVVCGFGLVVFTIAGGWRRPVKRRRLECWGNEYADGRLYLYGSPDEALEYAERISDASWSVDGEGNMPERMAVHMREV